MFMIRVILKTKQILKLFSFLPVKLVKDHFFKKTEFKNIFNFQRNLPDGQLNSLISCWKFK